MSEPNLSLGELVPKQANGSRVRPLLKMLMGAGLSTAMVGGSYWALQPKVNDGFLPAAARLLPENTVAVIGLTLNPTLLQKLGAVGNPQSRQAVQKRLTALQQEFLVGYQLEKDIQPWLDREIYLAYLNTDRTEKLLLLPIRPDITATQAMEKLKAKGALRERQYQGTPIWESAANSSVIAVINGFVVLSDRASAVERAIQASRSNQNLAGLADYQQARSTIALADPVVRGYLNLALATAGSKVTNRAQLRQGLAVNGAIEGNTLVWRGGSWGKARQGAVSTPALSLEKQLPEKSLWAVIGSDLGKFWQFYQPLASNNPLAPVPAETIVNGLKSAVNLDLSRDVLSWSQGEFAIALAPQNQAEKIPVGGGVLIMMTSKDRPATDKMLASLDKTMIDRYRYQVRKQEQETQWLSPVSGVQAAHGWLDNNVAFLSLGKTDRRGASLADRPEFQRVTSATILNATGRFFMDLRAMQSTGNLSLAGFPAETRNVLSAVQEVGGATASGAKFDLFELRLNLESVPSPKNAGEP